MRTLVIAEHKPRDKNNREDARPLTRPEQKTLRGAEGGLVFIPYTSGAAQIVLYPRIQDIQIIYSFQFRSQV